MSACSIIKSDPKQLSALKQNYLRESSGPLDGMWECFIAMADHYAINRGEVTIGYCIVNSDDMLVQFDLNKGPGERTVFRQCLSQLKLKGAFVSTREPKFLSLCMDEQNSVAAHSMLYHFANETDIQPPEFPADSEFRLVNQQELGLAVDFGSETLGADRDWLTSYFSERIVRQELFGLWENQSLTATGECRISDSQQPFADLGMMVSKQHRGRGLATSILRQLLHRCREKGLSAICSTEQGNVAAQKAIEKSGFISHHRILEARF